MTYRSKVAVVYLLGFFLDLINMFIASVAFPAMAQTYHATPSALAWVSNGYIAGLTLVIPFSRPKVGPIRSRWRGVTIVCWKMSRATKIAAPIQ